MSIQTCKFDELFISDSPLIRYLKLGIKETHVILAATQDEASMRYTLSRTYFFRKKAWKYIV